MSCDNYHYSLSQSISEIYPYRSLSVKVFFLFKASMAFNSTGPKINASGYSKIYIFASKLVL